MNKIKATIISALGEKSFSDEQVRRLKSCLDVNFLAQLNLLSNEHFISLVNQSQLIAVTRRSIRNIDQSIVDALPLLEKIAIYSTGYEWIDIDYLRQKNISLSYLPEYSANSVAEHTLAMILTMSRRIHLSFDKVRGYIPDSISLRGWELKNKRIGIIGFGTIGQQFAKLASVFSPEIVFCDKRHLPENGAIQMSLEELVSISDIVVITASQKRDTECIIGANEIALMRQGVFIVNSSRASLVDNQAVIAGINKRIVSGYAVDDCLDELNDADVEYGRILQTGHTAWYSNEALQNGTEQWVKNILGLAKGEPINIVGEGV